MDCCVFVHFGFDTYLPLPDLHFVSQIALIFERVIVVTNEREFELKSLPANVELKLVKNEGYDFGMFYKVIKEEELSKFQRLALINDSNVLIGDLLGLFDKGEALNSEFWGIIDSYEKPWYSTHRDNYHLQSHFLVWEKSGLKTLSDYLKILDIDRLLKVKDQKLLRRNIINDWEIGLSQFFLSKGQKPGVLFRSSDIASSAGLNKTKNLTIKAPRQLLSRGYPLLKKKYITKKNSFRNLFFPRENWKSLIENYAVSLDLKTQFINYFNLKLQEGKR